MDAWIDSQNLEFYSFMFQKRRTFNSLNRKINC